MTKEKLFKNRKQIIIACLILIALIVAVIVIATFNSSRKTYLDDFEKVAIYGYLEDFLTPSKLYYLSGKSNLDELQYTQVYVKKAIDNYIATNPSDIVPTSAIVGEVAENDLLKDVNLDFHGIAIPDYEYSPEQEAYVRTPGANAGLTFVDSNVVASSASTDSIKVTNIEKLSKDKYKVIFDLVDSHSGSSSNNGEATLVVEDNALKIESCNFNK